MDPRLGGLRPEERERSLAAWMKGTGAEIGQLNFGDFCIEGSGPGDIPVNVGVEFKTVSDLLGSLDTGRLTGYQIPGLVAAYPFRYLLVEGVMLLAASGQLTVRRGALWEETGWMYSAIMVMLDDIAQQAQVTVLHTADREQTYARLRSLGRAWARPWSERSTLHTVYEAPPPLFLPSPSQCVRIIHTLDGLGWKKARAAAAYFGGSARRAVAAHADVWEEIPGIGKKLAARIDAALGEA